MQVELDELTRVVGTMPRDLAREVLAFARYLERKHARTDDPTDWEEDYASRYGLTGEPVGALHLTERWDGDGPRGAGRA
jgi:hypothetical protein